MTHLTRTALIPLICLPLVGCALDGIDDGDGLENADGLSAAADDELSPDQIGSTQLTLCTDDAPNATVTFQDQGGFSGATSALPTNNYDHPACSDRYTVEVTGVSSATQAFSVSGGWGEGLPSTEAACELALANVQTHEYTLVSLDCSGGICVPVFGWQQVGGDITLRGEWRPFFDSYYCALVPDSPLPTLAPSVFRSKVRVAVRAYAWAILFPAFKRGTAGVYSQEIIY